MKKVIFPIQNEAYLEIICNDCDDFAKLDRFDDVSIFLINKVNRYPLYIDDFAIEAFSSLYTSCKWLLLGDMELEESVNEIGIGKWTEIETATMYEYQFDKDVARDIWSRFNVWGTLSNNTFMYSKCGRYYFAVTSSYLWKDYKSNRLKKKQLHDFEIFLNADINIGLYEITIDIVKQWMNICLENVYFYMEDNKRGDL